MVRIVGDTTAGLPAAVVERCGITVIPQIINVDDVSYLEGVEIDYETFLEKLESSADLPKTAAPPPELFLKAFQRLVPLGEPIICILPSAKVSGTVRSATVALNTLQEQGLNKADIRIVDTQVIASPVATLLRLASEWASAGVSADTIEARLREMSARCKIYFLVDTLKYLAKGGRIGGAAALLGSVLQVKPVLTFTNGEIDLLEKVRTHRRALSHMQELVLRQIAAGEDGHLTVMHSAAPEEAAVLADELRCKLGLDEVTVYAVPPAVVTHGGPGILGVGFFAKEDHAE